MQATHTCRVCGKPGTFIFKEGQARFLQSTLTFDKTNAGPKHKAACGPNVIEQVGVHAASAVSL